MPRRPSPKHRATERGEIIPPQDSAKSEAAHDNHNSSAESPYNSPPLIDQIAPPDWKKRGLILSIILGLLASGGIGYGIARLFTPNVETLLAPHQARFETALQAQTQISAETKSAHKSAIAQLEAQLHETQQALNIAQKKAQEKTQQTITAPSPSPRTAIKSRPPDIDLHAQYALSELALRFAQGAPFRAALMRADPYLATSQKANLAPHADAGIATQLDLIRTLNAAREQLNFDDTARIDNNRFIEWLKSVGAYFIQIRRAPLHDLDWRIDQALILLHANQISQARAQVFTSPVPALQAWVKTATTYIDTQATRNAITQILNTQTP